MNEDPKIKAMLKDRICSTTLGKIAWWMDEHSIHAAIAAIIISVSSILLSLLCSR